HPALPTLSLHDALPIWADDRLALLTKTASVMGEVTGADGGFLVPPEFVQQILQRVYAKSNLLGMTDSYTVSSNVIGFPRSSETSDRKSTRLNSSHVAIS